MLNSNRTQPPHFISAWTCIQWFPACSPRWRNTQYTQHARSCGDSFGARSLVVSTGLVPAYLGRYPATLAISRQIAGTLPWYGRRRGRASSTACLSTHHGCRRCQHGTPNGLQLAAAAPTTAGVTTAHGPFVWQDEPEFEYAQAHPRLRPTPLAAAYQLPVAMPCMEAAQCLGRSIVHWMSLQAQWP